MNEIVQRFWGFDKLIGPVLVKALYYVGLVVIALATLWAMAQSFDDLRYDALGAVGQFLSAPLGGAVALVFWRFVCEMSILAFSIHDRLGDIKDRLTPPPPPVNYGPPTPGHPTF